VDRNIRNAMYYHRVWAEIDLESLSFNLDRIKELLPRRTSVMVVIKADAYGHGAVHVARYLQNRGIWGFGVGDSGEALELRDAGITCPILILGAIIEDEAESVVKNGISVCIHSEQRAKILNREALRQRKRCRVHLMVDTGMGRLGVFPEKSVTLAGTIAGFDGLDLEGVATHYSCASNLSDPFNVIQQERFLEVQDALFRSGIRPEYFHASNSGAVFSDVPERFNLVRTGIAVYGVSAAKEMSDALLLRPVLSWKSQIIYMKDVPAETPIGYGCLHTTTRDTRIATLPVGYNDGLPYRVSGRGHVLVNGKRAPIVGAVSMDYSMIDVGHIQGTSVGDRVTLIGEDGKERIRAEDLAGMVETIPYEITCGIGKRVKRVAISGSADTTRPAKSFKAAAKAAHKSENVRESAFMDALKEL